MSEWYYRVMDEERGPVSGQELKRLAATGGVERDTHIRQGRDGRWATADCVRGLFRPIGEEPEEPPAEAVVVPPVRQPQRQVNLIHCPDCGTEVSPRAANCPKCACPVAATVMAAQQLAAAQERARQPRTSSPVLVLLLSPVVFWVLWMVLNTAFHTLQGTLENGIGGGYSRQPWAWITPVAFFLAVPLTAGTIWGGVRMERRRKAAVRAVQ